MEPFTLGYVSATPISQFFPTTVATVRLVRFDTINQVLHGLVSREVDLFAVEGRWFSDPKECDAVIETAKNHGIPVLLLTSYVQSGISQLTSLDPAEFLTQCRAPLSCVQFVPALSHRGQVLSLSSRAVQLLAIFVTYPGQVLRLVDINKESKSRHITTWTTHSLKSAIHSITQQVGPHHIKNVRGFGYIFQSCFPSSQHHDGEGVPEDIIGE
ncbi:MAG: helix-turn-helix domain-containing protein [Firmicutes bacterium]|nr:helix-turn-helix domain-containing protein [Bacillota bacterium]MCL5013148.1 helix-turn-helix domain-containing protein [Bacillota bacterium]